MNGDDHRHESVIQMDELPESGSVGS